jgi:YD repeat-containing protein
VGTRTDPLTREEDYTYDENGNLATVTDRKAQVTAYTYDPLDRLTLTTFDDSATTAYTYDVGEIGRPKSTIRRVAPSRGRSMISTG